MTMELEYETAYQMMYDKWDELEEEGLSEPEVDARMMSEAIEKIKRSPGKFIMGNFREIRRLWISSSSSFFDIHLSLMEYWKRGDYFIVFIKVGLLSCFTGLLVLMFIGIFSSLPLDVNWIILFGAIIYITAMQSFFAFNTTRYIIPVLPIEMIFSAKGIMTLWKKSTRYRAPAG